MAGHCRMPDTIKVYNFIDSFRSSTPLGPSIVTGPQHFKQSGRLAANVGKGFHPNKPPNGDTPLSWSPEIPYEWPYWTGCPTNHTVNHSCTPACAANGSIPQLFGDWYQKERIIRNIKYAAAQNRPWFLLVGFVRPHAAWQAPESMWKEHQAAGVPDTPSPLAPQALVDIAFTAELDGCTTIELPNGTSFPVGQPTAPIEPAFRIHLRTGYLSAVTWVDSLVGEVIKALNNTGQQDKTIVAVSSDHGYQLGDHSMFGKHTNWDIANRIPAIVHVPWLPESHGVRSAAFWEAVDLFPTLQSLAGIGVMPGAEGIDQSPLLSGTVSPMRSLRAAAFNQYARCSAGESPVWRDGQDMCTQVDRDQITWMGYAVRTGPFNATQGVWGPVRAAQCEARHANCSLGLRGMMAAAGSTDADDAYAGGGWRYIEWRYWDNTTLTAVWDGPAYGAELYDHRLDDGTLFGAFEDVNLGDDPGYAAVRRELSTLLRAQYDPASEVHHRAAVARHSDGFFATGLL